MQGGQQQHRCCFRTLPLVAALRALPLLPQLLMMSLGNGANLCRYPTLSGSCSTRRPTALQFSNAHAPHLQIRSNLLNLWTLQLPFKPPPLPFLAPLPLRLKVASIMLACCLFRIPPPAAAGPSRARARKHARPLPVRTLFSDTPTMLHQVHHLQYVMTGQSRCRREK